MGLVSNVFDDRNLVALTGHLAIGHTRYSTTGSSTWRNAQPFYRDVGDHSFALAHNGNLVNTEELAVEAGMLPGTVTSDSDLVAELIAQELAKLNVGGITKPRVVEGGVSMLAVCAKETSEDTTYIANDIRNETGGKGMQAEADKYLAELKAKAQIVKG